MMHLKPLLALIVALLMLSGCISVVEIGQDEVGVVFDSSSGELYLLESGRHVVQDVNPIVIYNTGSQSLSLLDDIDAEYAAVPARTSDGQRIVIELLIEYRLDPDLILRLHRNWQQRYLGNFIVPTVRSVTRDVVGTERLDDLLDVASQEAIAPDITEQLSEIAEVEGIIIVSVSFVSIRLDE